MLTDLASPPRRPLQTAFALLCAAISAPAQTTWHTIEQPVARASHSGAFDDDRKVLVIYGGIGTNARLTDTWEWDGRVWQNHPAAGSPPANGRSMVYHTQRRRVILFDYELQPWEWDGRTWTQLATAARPGARWDFDLVYDSARDRVVLFGGYSSGGVPMNDTWEWDGTTWTPRPTSLSPRQRTRYGMTYDSARQRVVLFGGWSGGPLGDTWEWDGTQWQQVSSVGPSARADHALAYDPGRARTVLAGGGGFQQGGMSDVWEWDGQTWTPGASGVAVGSAVLAYDPARRAMLLHGGSEAGSDRLRGPWAYHGTAWRDAASPGHPGNRLDTKLAFDANLGAVMLFGGYVSGLPSGPTNDTWLHNGHGWFPLDTATRPPARIYPGLAFDGARREMVLCGGSFLADTWTFDGRDWRQRTPAHQPPGRTGFAIAYAEAQQRVVLFGGFNGGANLDDTWTWDGTDWRLETPTNRPTARSLVAMAHDASRGRTVLFGGLISFLGQRDTWEWDGSNWLRRSPAVAPPARYDHAMTYDSRRQRVILTGGAPETTGTWEWDGDNWTQAAALPQPMARHAMAYDPLQDRTVALNNTVAGGQPDTLLYGALTPATAQSFGTGCGSGATAPRLQSTRPLLGVPGLRMSADDAPAQAAGVIGLSLGNQSLALGSGCTLYLESLLVTLPFVTTAGGTTFTHLQLAVAPELRGLQVFAQAAVVDQSPIGLAFTAGLRLTLGD